MEAGIVKSVHGLKAVYHGNIDEYADDESKCHVFVFFTSCHLTHMSS